MKDDCKEYVKKDMKNKYVTYRHNNSPDFLGAGVVLISSISQKRFWFFLPAVPFISRFIRNASTRTRSFNGTLQIKRRLDRCSIGGKSLRREGVVSGGCRISGRIYRRHTIVVHRAGL
jgi:hypothetical protein